MGLDEVMMWNGRSQKNKKKTNSAKDDAAEPAAAAKQARDKTAEQTAAEQMMLQNLVRGDQQVWVEFYMEYRPFITRCVVNALRRCGFTFTEADLEDIVAEVWIALLRYDRRKLRKFDATRAGLANWLGILATHCTIDYIRGRLASKRKPVDIEPQSPWLDCPEPEAHLELHQRVNLTLRAASKLDQRDQMFLAMCMEDRVPADLARELGIAVSTVHTRKYRLGQKLSRLVGQLNQQRPAVAI